MAENKVKVEAKGETELVITRDFNAPRELVYRAHTECQYMKRWLFGPDGWLLDVCEVDLRVGGKYRWVWKKDDISMGAGGEYREIERPARIVCSEQFDDPWYEGEALSTVEFAENGGVTRLVNTMRYSSKEARDGVLASPMADGMEISYKRLDDFLATESAQAAGSGD
jgi:uncharacterized protein YndB with AHSA1/START domain